MRKIQLIDGVNFYDAEYTARPINTDMSKIFELSVECVRFWNYLTTELSETTRYDDFTGALEQAKTSDKAFVGTESSQLSRVYYEHKTQAVAWQRSQRVTKKGGKERIKAPKPEILPMSAFFELSFHRITVEVDAKTDDSLLTIHRPHKEQIQFRIASEELPQSHETDLYPRRCTLDTENKVDWTVKLTYERISTSLYERMRKKFGIIDAETQQQVLETMLLTGKSLQRVARKVMRQSE